MRSHRFLHGIQMHQQDVLMLNKKKEMLLYHQTKRAELTPRPKSLHELWEEYTFGMGDQKSAKEFTQAED
jgi:hypothetical protein